MFTSRRVLNKSELEDGEVRGAWGRQVARGPGKRKVDPDMLGASSRGIATMKDEHPDTNCEGFDPEAVYRQGSEYARVNCHTTDKRRGDCQDAARLLPAHTR